MKSEERIYFKNIRKNVDKTNDFLIFKKVIRDINFINADTILIYVSTKYEVDTYKIIKWCLSNNKKVAVPKCVNENIIFYYIKSLKDLKIGSFNILEPITTQLADFRNSICFVPGLSFSEEGYRLGYGGGFYDRFLSKYPNLKIGLCYKECLSNTFTVEKHDIKVDYIITN